MLGCMRTTVTLDDDLAVMLENVRVSAGMSFKEALNEVVRLGINAKRGVAQTTEAELKQTTTFHLGKPTVSNMDNIAEVLAIAESDDYK